MTNTTCPFVYFRKQLVRQRDTCSAHLHTLMVLKKTTGLAVLSLFLFQTFVFSQAVVEERIRVTTPEAPWTLNIEGNPFSLENAKVQEGGKGAYFLLKNGKDGYTVSIFIEPAVKCKTSEECRAFVLKTGNPAWGKFQDLAQGSIGEFEYFEFFRPEVQGQPLKMQDMYAQFVGGGFWVDLHISKVLYEKGDRALFENLLRSVKFVPRNTTSTTPTDKLIEKVEKTAAGWFTVWDDKRCRESYNLLTSFSRQAVDENDWVEYCEAGHKATGKLSSRKLIATSLTRSLPGKPDYSGATLRYQSTFESGTAFVEYVSLTSDKTGAWTVSNYLPQ